MCALAAIVTVSAPAAAQQPSGAPFSGLFKGSPKDQPQTLDVRGSAFAAYDDDILTQAPGGGGASALSDPRSIKPGIANGFQASAAYSFHKAGTRSQFGISGEGSLQEFASSVGNGLLQFESYNVGTALRTSITNKSSISFSGGATYAPYYQYAPFLQSTTSEESPVGNDYGFAVNSEWVRSTSASASIEDRLTKKSSITGTIGWTKTVIVSGIGTDRDMRQANVSFSHNVTRKLALHVGYGIREERDSQQGEQTPPILDHVMDFGLGYGDGLTLTLGRHLTLSMSGGASIAKNGDPVSVAKTGKDTAFLVNGNATLSRSIGRSWGTSIGYVRSIQYIVGFAQPLNTDGANAGIGGPLARRLQFSAGGGASRGQQVFSNSGGSLVSYTASTKLTYGIFTNLGLYGQASYYKFSIPSSFITTPGLIPNLNRRSVSVGLSTWFALIKQRRGDRNPDQTPAEQP